jgi:CubicO group peptidase (beta-lactamase class C family)
MGKRIMKDISRRSVILGAAAITAGCAAQGTSGLVAPAASRSAAGGTGTGIGMAGVDQVLRQAIGPGKVAGLVATVGTDKETLFEAAYGKRNLNEEVDMSADSVFWIASMTKAVTCTAAMQMVEQGRLTLDDPIGGVLPELGSPRVLTGFDRAGRPKYRAARRPITLRHLLTHTAGFCYPIWNAQLDRYMKATGHPSTATGLKRSLELPLMFDPGDRWEYGINIDWAGLAVERVSGRKLGAYFDEYIFSPLGMTSTGFKLTPSQRARLVKVHARQPDGSLKPIDFEIKQDPEFEAGGGGLYSTAGDYLKFCRMFLNGGRSAAGQPVLRPETVAIMGTNQMGDLNVRPLPTHAPDLSADAEFFPGIVKKWSTAFMLNTEQAPTGRSAGSMAWAGLANTFFWIDPARKVTGVILMQILPFVEPQALDTFTKFETQTYREI